MGDKLQVFTGFNTQPPEGGWVCNLVICRVFIQVSTHSRLKAAGTAKNSRQYLPRCFNTQPPEGGWI